MSKNTSLREEARLREEAPIGKETRVREEAGMPGKSHAWSAAKAAAGPASNAAAVSPTISVLIVTTLLPRCGEIPRATDRTQP